MLVKLLQLGRAHTKPWFVHTARCYSLGSIKQQQHHVILMGSPGCGKSTVGRLLAEREGWQWMDVDDHHLEVVWGMPVAHKLSHLGGEAFLRAEGEAVLHLQLPNTGGNDLHDASERCGDGGHRTVLSLTGSNPLHKEAMEYIRQLGVVVFINVPKGDILNRLQHMKVNRIVGQESGKSMSDILDYRQSFYEANYDMRVTCAPGDSAQCVADKVQAAVTRYDRRAGYVSTRADCEAYYQATDAASSMEEHEAPGPNASKHRSAKCERIARENSSRSVTLCEATVQGLAPDGGLYAPEGEEGVPVLSLSELEAIRTERFPERAVRVLEKWVHPHHLHPVLIRQFVNEAYNADNFSGHDAIFPVRQLDGDVYIQELFHGPSASFKDAALQLMPKVFLHSLNTTGDTNRYVILVATSGDTGGAVIDGFSKLNSDSVGVFVLYPEHGISDIQKLQMTSSTGSNIRVIGIDADFDFCQTAIKQIFSDRRFSEELLGLNVKLGAANSINWARLLPQVVYHVTGYLDLVSQGHIHMGDEIDVAIPTGNFGNILAAYYAKCMGVPITELICASNQNNILTEFLTTGRYNLQSRQLHVSASPAIDILKSSNLERFLYHQSRGNSTLIREWYRQLGNTGVFDIPAPMLTEIHKIMRAGWCGEEECFQEMYTTYEETGYILDPHTAVARHVTRQIKQHTAASRSNRPTLLCSTAHPAKFAGDVMKALLHPHRSTDTHDQITSQPVHDAHTLLAALSHITSTGPGVHEQLQCSISSGRVTDYRCSADVQHIQQQLVQFARSGW